MIFALICTEGDVSEPAYIRAISSALGGQAPRNISTNVEILPIPLGGNQGHKNLLEVADRRIDEYAQSEDSLLGLVGLEDSIEKWIIVDFDDMDTHGIDENELRADVESAGYTLVVSKPNFEFFVLASMTDLETATTAAAKNQVKSMINERIATLNEEDSRKGFSKAALMPSKYSKKTYVAEKLFSLMLDRHPKLIKKAAELRVDVAADSYTEMPVIVRRLLELYGR